MNAMKKISHWLAVTVLFVSALAIAADRPSPSEATPLARLMPSGALAYVQARDLSALVAQWRSSKLRERYYASDSYRAFTRSRLYAKLQERLSEFEQGAGFKLTEARAAEMAGGLAAVTMYDMGKLEMVFITETPAAKAAATALFKQATRFEVRKRGAYQYYAQDLSTDGGRLNQALCFASVNGKFIIATAEPLMKRTLENFADGASPDRLSDAIAPTLAVAENFTSHAVTLWTDVPRLRDHKYFNLYWIHGKATALDGVAATLADLEITALGVRERRFSLLTADSAKTRATIRDKRGSIATLLPLLSTDVQFADLRTANEEMDIQRLAVATTRILFPAARLTSIENPSTRTTSASQTENDATRYGRYQTLDQRFDQDIDDPGSMTQLTASPALKPTPADPTETALRALLEKAEPLQFALFGRGRAEADSPFIHLDRAIVIEIEKTFDATDYERTISDALFRRLLVAGTIKRIEWRTNENGVSSPLIGVVEQGGAYAISGNILILANSATYCETLVKAFKTHASPALEPEMKKTKRFAMLRFNESLASYRQLIRLVDFAQQSSGSEPLDGETDGEAQASDPVPFMSRNLASLFSSVSPIDLITVESASRTQCIEERLTYRFAEATPTRNAAE